MINNRVFQFGIYPKEYYWTTLKVSLVLSFIVIIIKIILDAAADNFGDILAYYLVNFLYFVSIVQITWIVIYCLKQSMRGKISSISVVIGSFLEGLAVPYLFLFDRFQFDPLFQLDATFWIIIGLLIIVGMVCYNLLVVRCDEIS